METVGPPRRPGISVEAAPRTRKRIGRLRPIPHQAADPGGQGCNAGTLGDGEGRDGKKGLKDAIARHARFLRQDDLPARAAPTGVAEEQTREPRKGSSPKGGDPHGGAPAGVSRLEPGPGTQGRDPPPSPPIADPARLDASFLLCSKDRARTMTEEIIMIDLSMKALLEPYDWNLPLKDALDDSFLSADRRALAAAAMRQDLDDGYYAAAELLEAFRALEVDIDASVGEDAPSEGDARIRHVLDGEGDDYQRRLYYLLAERAVADAVSDLEWLVALMRGRAGMVRVLRKVGARIASLPGEDEAGEDDPIGCRPFGH